MKIYHKSNVGDNSPTGVRVVNCLFLDDIPRDRIPKEAEEVRLDGCIAKVWESHNKDLHYALEPEDSEDPGAVEPGYVCMYQCDLIQDIGGYIYIPDE